MERELRIIELKQDVFKKNEIHADDLRCQMKEENTLFINIMASPGAGKTTTLLKTIEVLKNKINIAVMEADIDASVDAEKMRDAGVKTVQLHTGGMCHMDAAMTKQGLNEIDTKEVDILFLENVGNLVCPAEFDTGAAINVAILSVPEGDDKPLKYPLMFQVCDLVLINKIDTKILFDFDDEKVIKHIKTRNSKAEIIFLSSKTGEGFEQWTDWLISTRRTWQDTM